MPELREVFEMTTRQVEPDTGAWRDQELRQRRTSRNRKIGAFIVVGAIVVAAIVVILEARGGGHATTPADRSAPATRETTEVATGFVQAFGAFDADRVISYLAADADISELEQGGVEKLPSMLSLLQGMGYQQLLDHCEEWNSSSAGTDVHCPFAFHAIRSNELGKGPYRGSSFDLTVNDGRVVRASIYFETTRFSPQVWEPFADWISATYPKDGAVMFDASYSNWRLTPKSIRLWRQHSREYVDVVTAPA